MTDDDGFPDPGQMTTSVAARRAGRPARQEAPRRAPLRVPPVDADVVGRDDWPDPGQDAARAGEQRRDPGGPGGGPAT